MTVHSIQQFNRSKTLIYYLLRFMHHFACLHKRNAVMLPKWEVNGVNFPTIIGRRIPSIVILLTIAIYIYATTSYH